MAARQVTLTHKGWFGLCPVYLAAPDSACPDVHERHWTMAPLMSLSTWFYDLCFAFAEAMDPLFEPHWPLKVTGKLATPLTVTLPEGEQP